MSGSKRQIIVNNSYSKIVGLTRSQLAELRKVFSYTDYSVLKFQKYPKVINAIDRYGYVGTGLVADIVQLFQKYKISIDVVDEREVPELYSSNFKMLEPLPFDPYPEQKEVVEELLKNHRGIGVLPTGVGKSATQILAIDALRVPTIIITPNLNLKKQLYDDMVDYFGKHYVNMLSETSQMKDITIANIQSLASYPDDIFEEKRFLIIDEMHHQAASSYIDANKNKFNQCYYRLGLTATPYRNDDRENMFLTSFLADTLVELPIETAIDKGYIVRPYFHAVEVSHTKEELDRAENWRDHSESKNEYHAIRSILVNDSKSYIESICNVIRKNAGKKTLVLIDHLDIAEKIQENLAKESLPDLAEFLVPEIVTGITEKNQKKFDAFNRGEIQLMIGSNVVGEGVNLKPVECLIVSTPIKSKPFTIQQWGRGLRKSDKKSHCDIYWFEIKDHPIFKNQSAARREYIKDFGKYSELVVDKS